MLDRRQLLIRGLLTSAYLPHLGGAWSPGRWDLDASKRLVVLQLSGGNDSLNTVVPLEQDAWYRLRPTLSGIAPKARRIAPGLGLHPALDQLAQRFEQGQLGLLHGVGYPQPDRSHFRSMEIWHTGRVPGDPRGPAEVQGREGWLGRAAETLAARGGDQPVALFVGPEQPELSFFAGGRSPAAVADRRSLKPDSLLSPALLEALDAPAEQRSKAAALLANTAAQARVLGSRLEAAAAVELKADWPRGELADKLALIAQSIRAGLPPRLYGLVHDGFDTHLRQAGPHARLLGQLDGALGAFLEELERAKLSDRVAVLVFSEFGRRAAENGSAGTDHGAAGAVLLAAPNLKAREFGQRPDLAQLEEGDVPYGIDLRALYDGLRRDWLGLPVSGPLPPLKLFSS